VAVGEVNSREEKEAEKSIITGKDQTGEKVVLPRDKEGKVVVELQVIMVILVIQALI
jgi:hypothetical protein